MTKCIRCQVDVADNHLNCPLCGIKLRESIKDTHVSYPEYPQIAKRKKLLVKVWTFVTISIIVFSLAINALTWKVKPIGWSPILSIAVFYIWFLGQDLYQKFNINLVAKTLWNNYLILTVFFLIVDNVTGYGKWSLNFVIPFLGIATGFIMTLWSVKNKSMWRDDIGYILLILGVNVLPFILFLLKAVDVLWPSIASLLYGVMTVVGIFIFSGRRLLYELQKRFHF
ncbi:DUF6320 domain-containing protein [Vagococcus elongatus]|uniref:Zinc ribbon domain-containing protein n=1 Tax=Vagococcus elongatus TaxID=180344 RepID=A0A430B5W3_9ENTE|nr:DUF6320 domain-containing protein [Vagococcus elongatus]RSU15702.1 hypothetical protein CBF29_01110 [Vagococcus elongatus]